MVRRINPNCRVEVEPFEHPLLDINYSVRLKLDGKVLGYLGQVSAAGLKQFKIRSGGATVAELDFTILEEIAVHVTIHKEQSRYQAVAPRFPTLSCRIRSTGRILRRPFERQADNSVKRLTIAETFRDEKKDGAGMKRLLMSVTLRLRK